MNKSAAARIEVQTPIKVQSRYWPKQFSLRTLLIGTTLVAVGLGLIVWLR
jgi:hypothetical protein